MVMFYKTPSLLSRLQGFLLPLILYNRSLHVFPYVILSAVSVVYVVRVYMLAAT